MLCFVRHDFPSQVSRLICTLQNLQLAREKFFERFARGEKQRPIELSSRVRPLIASTEYDSEFRRGTPSHSIVSCFVRVEGRFAMSERDYGGAIPSKVRWRNADLCPPYARNRGRGNALSGDHYCCHKGAEKGRERGNSDPVHRGGGGYLPSLSGRSIPCERRIIATLYRGTPPVFLYFDFNCRELARACHRLVISALFL